MQFASILLLVAVCCGGLAGSFVRIIQASPMLKLAWRQLFSFLIILPLALYQSGLKIYPNLFLGGVIQTIAMGSFVVSCHLTKLSHTYIFANLSPIFVLIYNYLFKGQRPTKHVLVHLIICLISSFVIMVDKTPGKSSLAGDLVGLVSGMGFAGICLFNSQNNQSPPLNTTATLNGISTIILILLTIIFENTHFFSWDPHQGFFGVFTAQQLSINFSNAVLTGLGCASLISYCSRSLDPLIVTTALLFEPISAILISWALNIQRQQSILTWALTGVIINSLYSLMTLQKLRQSEAKKSVSSNKSSCQLQLLQK